MRKSSFTKSGDLNRNGREDLTAKVFGRLSVLRFAGIHKGHTHWQCECSCGTLVICCGTKMKGGFIKSCGCYSREVNRNKGARLFRKHPSEYRAWVNMKARCNNPKHAAFKDYGGRGVSVCDRWKTFEGFYNDMGHRPSVSHSIERRDNDGDYCKENCYWGTRLEQNNNKRNNRMLTHNGETKSMSDWERHYGVKKHHIRNRIKRVAGIESIFQELDTLNKSTEEKK